MRPEGGRALMLGVAAAALVAACKGSTSPHQPTPCPTYSGGLSADDSLYGLYHLVSYCLDTLPAYGPPADTGHVTLKKTTSADSFVAVIVTAGQPPTTVSGTYTLPPPDSIHVTGQITTPLGPAPVELLGRFLLQHDLLSVSGRLSVSAQPLSLQGARLP